jgi:hypothetical protein
VSRLRRVSSVMAFLLINRVLVTAFFGKDAAADGA